MITGLNTDEVNERLASFGYNELPSDKPKSIFGIAKEVLTRHKLAFPDVEVPNPQLEVGGVFQ